MLPNEFASRYHRIEIPCPDGATTPVDVRKYLSSLKVVEAKDRLWGLIGAEFHRSKSITVKVFTNGAWVDYTFKTKGEMAQHVVSPYCGKASPETVQAMLQLVLRLDPKKWTKATIQSYCDAYMGLDCNGFVGNYLRHGLDGRPWYDVQHNHDKARGPSTDIATMVGNRFVKSASDLHFTDLYVLGMVDQDNRVLPGGGNGTGHVIAVQPCTLVNKVLPPFMQDKCYTNGYAKDPAKNPTFWAVESTGGMGLTASWYNVLSVDKGIFTVYRGCKSGKLRVRVAPVL